MDRQYYLNVAKLGGSFMVACYGGDTDEDLVCDGKGILPFELPSGEIRLFCRLHLHRRRVQAYEARLLAERKLEEEMWSKQYGSSQEEGAA